ncbi:Fic family protein [Microvirga sp. 2YAF29]|uniref:Fic family protein n=1 Tax=Microvirga sp. 2YAF29 TaxID=3233031 RepID=UPI003F963C9A
MEAIARLDGLAAERHDPYIISRVLARQEAISSSAIEGIRSTLDELLLAGEMTDEEARGTAAQVRDYAGALDTVLPRAQTTGPDVFTIDLVLDLHRAVVQRVPGYRDTPGCLRDAVVWIGSGRDITYSTYNPTPPEDVAPCLAETLSYMRSGGSHVADQPLLVRMAIAHAHFEAVHPFRDGNGRVGRLLLSLMMAAEGHVPLYLSAYIEAHRHDYYEALKAAQQRLDWSAMVRFMADAVIGTANELMVTRKALLELEATWRRRRQFRAGSAAARALQVLPHFPMLTVNRLARLLGISFPAASNGIEQLIDAKILLERTGYQRNRIFAAPEALLIVNRPFGEAPLVSDG